MESGEFSGPRRERAAPAVIEIDSSPIDLRSGRTRTVFPTRTRNRSRQGSRESRCKFDGLRYQGDEESLLTLWMEVTNGSRRSVASIRFLNVRLKAAIRRNLLNLEYDSPSNLISSSSFALDRVKKPLRSSLVRDDTVYSCFLKSKCRSFRIHTFFSFRARHVQIFIHL